MSKSHPFQCIQAAPAEDQDGTYKTVLFGAAGSRIYSFSFKGAILSEWPSENDTTGSIENGNKRDGNSPPHIENGEPPEKKRRVSSPHPKSESSSAEFVLERPKRRRRPGEPMLPTVTKLAVTRDYKCLVAVTAEDKCLRVFNIGPQGKLLQESQRNMPKRPCSIVLTPDDSIILCGDKFGDVYALPLHASTSTEIQPRPSDPVAPKPFKPSASELTVHTKGNRLTLENQLRNAQIAHEKAPLPFEHRLILGHVSLLTDLKYVSVSADQSPSGREREYILTSDRDEHIRVSRGLPQSHITEHFCLGHREFVSKLYVPDWQRDLLISGGGDSFLLVWRWTRGDQLQKVDLSQHVVDFLQGSGSTSQSNSTVNPSGENEGTKTPSTVEEKSSSARKSSAESIEIAVTGIWAMRHKESASGLGEVIVTCEGIAALFCYQVDSTGNMTFHQTLSLGGNALDLVVQEDSQFIVTSIDHLHKPNSTQTLRTPQDEPRLLSAFHLVSDSQGSTWRPIFGWVMDTISRQDFEETIEPGVGGKDILAGSLYTMEALRKRVQGDME